MGPEGITLCLLLMAGLIGLDSKILPPRTTNGNSNSLFVDNKPCEAEADRTEAHPGEVIEVLTEPIEFGWGEDFRLNEIRQRRQPTTDGYSAPVDGVRRVHSWDNIETDYYMECYENTNEGKFRANIYHVLTEGISAELTVELTSCEAEILNSITVMPRKGTKLKFLTIDRQSCCSMRTIDTEESKDWIDKCPGKNKRGPKTPKFGKDTYTNGWKESSRD